MIWRATLGVFGVLLSMLVACAPDDAWHLSYRWSANDGWTAVGDYSSRDECERAVKSFEETFGWPAATTPDRARCFPGARDRETIQASHPDDLTENSVPEFQDEP